MKERPIDLFNRNAEGVRAELTRKARSHAFGVAAKRWLLAHHGRATGSN
jgi:hypothetical protein